MNELIINEKENNCYIELKPVRSISNLKKANYGDLLTFDTPCDPYLFLEKVKNYENNKKRDFKKNYEARYGYKFTILLPEGNWDLDLTKKFIKKFVDEVRQKEKGLKYISWIKQRGKGKYVTLYISDREYYAHQEIAKYDRDLYLDKNTKQWTSAGNPDAVLWCKKGEIKKDKNGEKIVKMIEFKKRKSRRFCFKESDKKDFYQSFRDLFIQVVKKVKKNIKSGLLISRENLRKAKNAYQRRSIIALNTTKQIIQNELNIRLWRSKRYPDAYEIYAYGANKGELYLTPKSKKVKDLFNKYRNIFKQGFYQVENVSFDIKYNIRCDIVEQNLIYLKSIFHQELASLDMLSD